MEAKGITNYPVAASAASVAGLSKLADSLSR
jgi:hypothetical protein